MATVTRKGKQRIITNDGKVQLNLNDNRVLVYDGDKYRFVAGDRNDGETKIQMSLPNQNVLE